MNDEEAEKLPVKGTSIVCVWYLSTSLRIRYLMVNGQ